MKNKHFFFLLLCGILLTSCGFPVRFTEVRGSGNVVTETRLIAGINAVELSGIGTLIIEQGNRESLEISAEENLMDYLRSDISGSRLILGVEDYVTILPTRDIIFRLTVKDLKRLETSGMGKVEIKQLTTDRIILEISGSGRLSMSNLQAQDLILEISGMGDITANGSVEDQAVEISGSGSYNAPNLASRNATVDISGSGVAIIWASERLDVDVSGSGKVHYYGSPSINSEMSGSGIVKNLGNK